MALLLGACGGPAPTPTATAGTPLALLGTTWTLTELHGEPLMADTSITLAFTSGYLGGRMTCNQYGNGPDSGDFTATDAGDFQINLLAVTVQLCTEPAGLMEQEEAYITALQAAKHYAITGDVLALSDADGQVTLTYARQAGALPTPSE
ncbi:MAG: META domain-containing protein [Anaerolineales bacterium]|nr:META domain-containing protein [Anaerolineales bacterium]